MQVLSWAKARMYPVVAEIVIRQLGHGAHGVDDRGLARENGGHAVAVHEAHGRVEEKHSHSRSGGAKTAARGRGWWWNLGHQYKSLLVAHWSEQS